MHDALSVQVLQCEKDLLHDAGGLVFRETSSLDYFPEEFAALAVLHDYVEALHLLEELVEADYVWVVQGPEDADLVVEHRSLVRRGQQVLADYFHCTF